MTAATAAAALRDSLATAYPARLAEQSNAQGVTCVVVPSGAQYDTGAMCDPVPVTVTADIVVIAAGTGEAAVADLLTRIDPVAALIRGGGWEPTGWTAADVDDRPAITFTATTDTTG